MNFLRSAIRDRVRSYGNQPEQFRFLSLFSQRSDIEESPASIYESDEEESDTVSIFLASS